MESEVELNGLHELRRQSFESRETKELRVYKIGENYTELHLGDLQRFLLNIQLNIDQHMHVRKKPEARKKPPKRTKAQRSHSVENSA